MTTKNNLDQHSNAYMNDFSYDLDNELILHWYPQRVAKKLKAGSLLELGLGHGYSAQEFCKMVENYSIIDGSEVIIKQFREKNPDLLNVNIIHNYFETYTSSKLYDNIVMGFILEHVDDPLLILERYKNFLSKDGKVFITVPNADSLHRRFGLHAGMIENLTELAPADLELGHKRYFNLASLTSLIERSGLRITSTEGLFLKPITTSQLLSLNLPQEILQSMMVMGIEYPELSTALLIECQL